jgi:hypothetical protein
MTTEEFKPSNDDLLNKGAVLAVRGSVFKVDHLASILMNVASEIGLTEANKRLANAQCGQLTRGDWCNSGMDCEILVPGGQGWQKGKVRFKFCLEFCLEEPDPSGESLTPEADNSPLDGLRRLVND